MRTRGCGLIAICLAAVGCESPEANRARGSGPGGDSQNRPANVVMHEGSRQYFATPVLIPDAAGEAPLEPARHAQTVETPE